jgi:predicted amidohydrolase YtcJ
VALLITDADIGGRRRDLWVDGGRIVHPGTPTDVIDARGGAVLPGFTDHHLHLHALAAARRCVHAGRSRDDLATALRHTAPDPTGWIRVVGSDDDLLDATTLDRIRPDVPVRVQHRSGAMWVLNSAALTRIGPLDHPGLDRDPDGTPTGRLHRGDDWLRDRLPRSDPPDVRELGRALAGYGITAVTDATPDLDDAAISSLTAVPQRLTLLGVALGSAPPPGTEAGPYKIVLADSDLPDPDELAARIREAHAAGRPVAVHSVTRESLILLLVALEAADRLPGDRIEHAALVPDELRSALRGLVVVTQPGFIADRGDLFRRGTPPEEHADLYRCGSLRAAGVSVRLSSDAPYGPVDPWLVLRAATTRRTPDGSTLGPAEVLTPREAMDALTGVAGPRTLRPGDPADLVLLHVPLDEALRVPDRALVRTTFIDGRQP